MRQRLAYSIAVFSVLCAVPAHGDDEQKAIKEVRKITAMASDTTARAIVSRTMADVLHVQRDQLVRERQAMNLNYGSLFVAHQLATKSEEMSPIASQLEANKSIIQIVNDRRFMWKQVWAGAHKLNDKIQDNIYKHFLHAQTDKERDIAEKYDAVRDWVKADSDATQPEVIEAQETYVLWRDRAAQIGGKGDNVGSSEELASRRIEEHTHEIRIPAPSSR
jgi:hypothetical protein